MEIIQEVGTRFQISSDKNKLDLGEIIALIRGGNLFSKEQYLEARCRHPLDPRMSFGTIYSATADYLFKCSICEDLDMHDQWYRLILDTLGGSSLLQVKTTESDLINGYRGDNILRLIPGDKTDYQSSGINHVPGYGYICDHCMMSVFEDASDRRDL